MKSLNEDINIADCTNRVILIGDRSKNKIFFCLNNFTHGTGVVILSTRNSSYNWYQGPDSLEDLVQEYNQSIYKECLVASSDGELNITPNTNNLDKFDYFVHNFVAKFHHFYGDGDLFEFEIVKK